MKEYINIQGTVTNHVDAREREGPGMAVPQAIPRADAGGSSFLFIVPLFFPDQFQTYSCFSSKLDYF